MATVLGSCGCCGGGCGNAREKCEVVLRQFPVVADPLINITTSDQYAIGCWESRNSFPCQGISFSATSFDPCTGEGIISYSYINGDGSPSQPFEFGTSTANYSDEIVDWDKVEELELTDSEKERGVTCKVSYKFSFDPEEDAQYMLFSSPCADTVYKSYVNLSSEGKITFYVSYNATSEKCVVT